MATRIAVINAGLVIRVIEATDGTVIDEDGKVARCTAERVTTGPNGTTSEPYETVIAAEDGEIFVASDVVENGWSWDGEAFVEPPVDPDHLKSELLAYAAEKRWKAETAGIAFGGVPVATDDRSKMLIIGARAKADADAGFSTRWKTSGGFVDLDAATMISISDAVFAHVDACFAAEDVIAAGIEAGTITTTAEIDAAAWPSP